MAFIDFICLDIDACQITIKLVPDNSKIGRKQLILKFFLLFLYTARRQHLWILRFLCFKKVKKQ